MDRVKIRLLKTFLPTLKYSAGQGFVEYVMIIALVALGLVIALSAFQGQLSTALSTVGGSV
jgi:Flp pilus assembly pilin Flp